jgi:hypothetical protein
MKQTRLDRKAAIALYIEKTGRRISFNGLTYIGKVNQFIEQAEDGFHYYFLKEKMIIYLDKITEKLPVGYMTIQQLAEKYNSTYTDVRNVLFNNDCIEYGKRKLKAYKESDYIEQVKGEVK